MRPGQVRVRFVARLAALGRLNKREFKRSDRQAGRADASRTRPHATPPTALQHEVVARGAVGKGDVMDHGHLDLRRGRRRGGAGSRKGQGQGGVGEGKRGLDAGRQRSSTGPRSACRQQGSPAHDSSAALRAAHLLLLQLLKHAARRVHAAHARRNLEERHRCAQVLWDEGRERRRGNTEVRQSHTGTGRALTPLFQMQRGSPVLVAGGSLALHK